MPDILYVTSEIPWPLRSGLKLRQYHILQGLCRAGDVDLISLYSRDDPALPEELRSVCRHALVHRRNSAIPNNELGYLRRIVGLSRACSGWPDGLDAIPSASLEENLIRCLSSKYDLIWIERMHSAAALGIKGGSNTVLDLDDVEHLKRIRWCALTGARGWQRWRELLECRAWRIAERRAMHKFARALVCSENDAEYLGRDNIRVLPNGVTMNECAAVDGGVPGRMSFVGLLSYAPNVDAIRFFVRDVLPRIRQTMPHAHLQVVGRGTTPEILALHDGRSVEVVGEVDNVVPYVQAAQVSVCPIRVGGGTRLKILEALSQKRPVVSTTIGAEGLDLNDEEHLVLADSASEMANKCMCLLRDARLRQRLAEAGFQRVRELYTWSAVEDKVVEIGCEVIRTGSASAKRQHQVHP